MGDISNIKITADYAYGFEDAYRRLVMHENVPIRQPVQIITQETEDQYIASYNAAVEEQKRFVQEVKAKHENAAPAFEAFKWEEYEGKSS